MPSAETEPARGVRRGVRTLVVALLGAAAALAVGATATSAASDPPSYRGCISSDSDVAGCTPIPGAVEGGEGTGLDGLSSVAVSADGLSVYAASELGDAVARFDRDPATGAVGYAGCITADTEVSGCTPIPDGTASGTDTGLDAPQAIAVSADGTSVYAASFGGDAVARFARDEATGALAFADCITGDSDVAGCAQVPSATPGGSGTGLDRLTSIAVSADGTSVYATSDRDDAVSLFEREPSTGELSFAGCHTSDSTVAGCTEIAAAAEFGEDTALDALSSVAVSADGASVYTAAELGDAVAWFDRDQATGELAYEGCVTSNTAVAVVGECAEIAAAAEFGEDTGLDTVRAVGVSADGLSVYAAAFDADAITHFDRDPETGALEFAACITSAANVDGCAPIPGATPFGTDTGLDGVDALAASADGERVYTASFDGDAVARFDRDALTGELAYRDCTSSNADAGACTLIPGATSGGTNTGLDALRGIAVSAGGESIYTASFDGDALARFDRNPPGPPVDPPSNQFRFGKVARNARRGTATLIVDVPGPGRLVLVGPGVRRVARGVAAAGRVRLAVRARGRVAKQLRRSGRVRVSARVTYTPEGGAPRTKPKRIKLVRRR